MNNLGNVQPPGNSKKQTSQSTNPFARALAESEKHAYGNDRQASPGGDNNLFSEALAKAGGQLPEKTNPEILKKQQEKLEAERKKAEMRKKLHDQVNPVDQEEIFSARKVRTQKELEEVRKELKKLAEEISKFHKEIDVAVTQNVVDQGFQGSGLKSFFAKLKATIIMLTQQVRSQRTWLKQQQVKQSKKKRKVRGGILMETGGKTEAKAVFDMMHHERSNAYSGG